MLFIAEIVIMYTKSSLQLSPHILSMQAGRLKSQWKNIAEESLLNSYALFNFFCCLFPPLAAVCFKVSVLVGAGISLSSSYSSPFSHSLSLASEDFNSACCLKNNKFAFSFLFDSQCDSNACEDLLVNKFLCSCVELKNWIRRKRRRKLAEKI